MALTTSEIKLGFKAPHFNLPNVINEQRLTLEDVSGLNGTLVMFICNHCPYVVHVLDELISLGKDYMPKGMGIVAISSNDVLHYPQDSPERMKELAIKKNFPFPYLYDETQETAKAYDARCTPDFSLFNENLECVYRGRLDGSSPGNGVPITGKDLRRALEDVIAGNEINWPQFPSMGCGIKWKK